MLSIPLIATTVILTILKPHDDKDSTPSQVDHLASKHISRFPNSNIKPQDYDRKFQHKIKKL